MRGLRISMSIFIVLFLIFFSIRSVIFDRDFYFKEYEKYNVYDTFNRTTVHSATDNLMNYLRGDEELSDFFNEREKEHMKDVKGLVERVDLFFYFFLILILINMYLLYKRKGTFLKNVTDSFILSTLIVFFVTIGLYGFRKFFSQWFTAFHLVFFTNDLWILNPITDNMILLFPEQFFYDAFFQIVLRILISSIALAVIALILKMHSKS